MIRVFVAAALCLWAMLAQAQEFSGLARLLPEGSGIADTRRGIEVTLRLSQGVPYRVFTLDAPRRLVLDFREVDWRGADMQALDDSDRATAVRAGGVRPGWSRMVVDLDGAYALATADLAVDAASGAARLAVRLHRVTEDAFAARSGAPETSGWAPTTPAGRAENGAGTGDRRLLVVLDPGHGGIDPGAEAGGVREKDLVLAFARELTEVLRRTGEIEVRLTRTGDRFVSLERRVAIAHRAGADLFLSLHADMLSEGRAQGATVYTLSERASDAASAALAERHNRSDLMAGLDLSGQDDEVAGVLMHLARQETQPRAERLAEALRLGLRERGLALAGRPMRSAGFSVLKSADVPSVLLELGFLSNEKDRARLQDPAWRAAMAAGIRDAIIAWRMADAAAADLVRR